MDFFVSFGQKFNYLKSSLANTLFAPHIHPGYELYVCLESIPRAAILNGQEIPICCPCAILFAPYSVHSNIAQNKDAVYTRYSFYFGDAFLARYESCLSDLPMLQSKNSCIFLLNPQCAEEIRQVINLVDNTAIRSTRQEVLLVYLLRHLHHYNINNKIQPQDILHISSPSYIPDVIRYVVENIGTPLHVSDIAAHFFVSKNKLSQDFKAFTSISVHKFIVHVKLSIAQYELRHGDQTVQEVSRRMGFENEIYFYAFFRKNAGMTPLQWKKGSAK